MKRTRHSILSSVFIILMTTSCSVSTNTNSDKASGNGVHNLDDASLSGESDSNVRFKRMSAFQDVDKNGDMYGTETLLDSMGESLDEDSYNGRESGYDLDKKASSFVRIGRLSPMNRFIRIGRFYGNEPSSNEPTYDDISGEDKRASHFVRIGKSPSSFVRIGKSPSSFVRIGKSERDDNYYDDDGDDEVRFDKRASNFVRIGKSYESPSDSEITFANGLKRASHFVRIGRGPSSFVRIGKSPSSFVRIGKSPSSFVRIGKSHFDAENKRGNSFVRIGKNSVLNEVELPDVSEKRASSFVRIGRSEINDRDLIKRVSNFVRIGKSTDNDSDLLKRASSFVRIGKSAEETKRASSFVRIGKSKLSDDNDKDKRISSFVRIGKSGQIPENASDLEKRGSSFVRIGKSLTYNNSPSAPSSSIDQLSSSLESIADENLEDNAEPIRIANRGSAFVRIGKIPSTAFVRIGKNKNTLVEPVEYNRGLHSNKSSFVRIGK